MTDLTQQQRSAVAEVTRTGDAVAEVFRVIEMIADDVGPDDRDDLLDAVAEALNRQAEFLRAIGLVLASTTGK